MLLMDAAYANAKLESGLCAEFRLLDRWQRVRPIVRRPDGGYEEMPFFRSRNFGDRNFDADLIAVYCETCERIGDNRWLRMESERRGPYVYAVPTAAAKEAVAEYRRRRGIKLFTEDVILG